MSGEMKGKKNKQAEKKKKLVICFAFFCVRGAEKGRAAAWALPERQGLTRRLTCGKAGAVDKSLLCILSA